MTALPTAPAPFPIDQFRRIRFRHGLFCPRCDSRRVQRWGRFGWRRRYRCLACRRTFSDFTGTPLAYLKRVELWESHTRLALRTTTIRRSAHLLGLHTSSAFRWRHRLLAGLLDTEVVELCGRVRLASRFLAYSETGARDLSRPPRHVAFDGWSCNGRIAWVLAAVDERGQAFASRMGERRPGQRDVLKLLTNRLGDGVTLLSREGPFGAVATAAHILRLPCERDRAPHLGDGVGKDGGTERPAHYLIRWKRWLRRFRGVATRYLDHYLVWFRLLDRVGRGADEEAIHRLFLLGSFP